MQLIIVMTTCFHLSYSWLNDKNSSDYKYYEQRVEELKEAKKRAQNEGLLPVKSEKGFALINLELY